MAEEAFSPVWNGALTAIATEEKNRDLPILPDRPRSERCEIPVNYHGVVRRRRGWMAIKTCAKIRTSPGDSLASRQILRRVIWWEATLLIFGVLSSPFGTHFLAPGSVPVVLSFGKNQAAPRNRVKPARFGNIIPHGNRTPRSFSEAKEQISRRNSLSTIS